MAKGKDSKGKHSKSKSKASGSVTNGKSSSGPSNQKMTPKCKKLPKGKLALPTPKDAGKAKRGVQPSKTGKSKSKAHKMKSSAKTTKSSLKSGKSSTKPIPKNLKGKSAQKEKSILKTKSLTKAKPLKTKSSLGAASSLKGKQVSKTKSSKTKSNFKINSMAKVRSSMPSKSNAEKSFSKSSKSGQANKDENFSSSTPSMSDIKAKLSKTGIKSPEIPSEVGPTSVDVQPNTKSPIKTNEENGHKSAVEAPVKTGTPPSAPRKMKMKRKKVTAKSMGQSEGSGSTKKSAGKEAPEGLLTDKSNYQDTIDAIAKSAVIEAAKQEEPKLNQLAPEKLPEEKTKETIKETEIEAKKSPFGKQVHLVEGAVGTTETAVAAVQAASPPQVTSPANQPDSDEWEYSWEEVEIPTYEYVYEYDLVDEKDLHKYNPKELMLMEEPREDVPKKAASTTKDQIETTGKVNNSELKLVSGSPKSPPQNVAIVNEMTAKDKDNGKSHGAVSGQSEAVELTGKTASKEKSQSYKAVIETSVPDDAINASPLDAKGSQQVGESDGHTPTEGHTMAPVGAPKSPSSTEKAAQTKSPPMNNDFSQTPSKVNSAHVLAQSPPTSLTLEPSQVPNKENYPGEAAEAITVQVNPVSDVSVLEKVLEKKSPSSSFPGTANEPKCLENGKTSLQKTVASSSFEQPAKQLEVSLSIKSPPSTTGEASDGFPKIEDTSNDPFPKLTDIKSNSEGKVVSKSSPPGEKDKDKGPLSLVKMNKLQSTEKVLSPPSVPNSPSGSGKIKLQLNESTDEPKSVEGKENPKPTDTLPSGQISEAKKPTKETIQSPSAQVMAPNPSAGCKMVSPTKAPETGELAKGNVENSSTSPASSAQENEENRHESKESN